MFRPADNLSTYPSINAGTGTLGLIGHPAGHSLSPAIHNAAFEALGMNFRYLAWDVEPHRLGDAVAGARALGFAGLNVTIPYKESVVRWLDELSPSARNAGAVNVIENKNGHLTGHNTDGAGFLRSLALDLTFDPAGKTVLILGAGGAARALAAALLAAGVGCLTLANRSVNRARDIMDVLSRTLPAGGAMTAVDLCSEPLMRSVLTECDLVINCTPVGMHPATGFSPLANVRDLPEHCLVADTIFNPRRTNFMALAETRGLRTIGGQGMLVQQAALAWEIWFGRPGPVDTMTRALDQALGVNKDPETLPREE